MSSILGPFDKRAQRKRCHGCIRSHLKARQCESGLPCSNCIRTRKTCTPPPPRKSMIVIGDPPRLSSASSATAGPGHHLSMTRPVQADLVTRYISHFFTSFLCCNNFSGKPSDGVYDVRPFLQDSSGLRNALSAIAASDVHRRRNGITAVARPADVEALRFYRAAIASVQAELRDRDVVTNESVLWSTFFLGMFELMYDVSGEGWIKHILHGTSQLLQYRGPSRHLTGPGRKFFLAVRIFEICRALIYSSPTFLAQKDWQELMDQMWAGDGAQDWHPKEALYDLMIACSALSIRGRKMVDLIQANPADAVTYTGLLRETAEEGFRLWSALSNWKTSACAWSTTSNPKFTADLQMMLATIYHHAISIYLSGTFDYFPYWNENHIPAPVLSQEQIQTHVTAILQMVARALQDTNLAGILFLFPLRVAGARARSLGQRYEIARMLGDVTRRGYVVADAFTEDLETLWECRGIAEVGTGLEV